MPDASKPRGKFRDVADVVRQRIISGELTAGALVPSESALCAEFGIARGTARAALAELETAGLIKVVPGKGRVVRGQRDEGQAPNAAELLEQLKERVRSGVFEDGGPFLSESEIAEEFGVSRHAARRALGALEAGGILVSVQGRRRTVAPGVTGSDGH
jgi:DNA-binding GntR family transcriptional regulator